MKFQIITPSRIHMSLMDLNGDLGRIDGGFGFCIENPQFKVDFSNEFPSILDIDASPDQESLVHQLIEKIEAYFKIKSCNLKIEIHESIPQHMGLGSKTQFLLTLAKGILLLNGLQLSERELAKLIQRGGTSGIGYQTFSRGGFIMDLGHEFGKDKEKSSFIPSSASTASPALPFLHYKLPEAWRIILINLNIKQGANKKEEVDVFASNTPIKKEDIEKISRHTLFELIPGILTEDLFLMGKALQFINMHGFKHIEIKLQHPYLQKLIEFIEAEIKYPVGMSSFGPAIYLITPNEEKAIEISQILTKKINDDEDSPGGNLFTTKINNQGYRIVMN